MKTIWNILAAIVLVAAMVGCSMPTGMNDTAQNNESNAAGVQLSVQTSSINVAPSQVNPGNFPLEKTPMFVTIGWDDNGYSGLEGSAGTGAMKWTLDYFANKVNPGVAGTGVYDGTPARVSFFNTSVYGDMWMSESYGYVRKAWNDAYKAGHEIGNHSVNHPNDTSRTFTLEKWLTEMQGCHDMLTRPFDPNDPMHSPSPGNGAGIASADITGFRNPHLAYTDNTFKALKQMGYEYDCSINEGFEYDQDGTNFFWPYTLDNGSPGNKITHDWGTDPLVGSHPGIFELPVYALIVPPDNKCAEYGVPAGFRAKMKAAQSWFDDESGKITGFDYNLWFLFNMNKAEFLATLKYSFDLRHNGNKAPFMLGAHTDYYSSKYGDKPHSTVKERQEAITEFMDYAMSKQDVRVVPMRKILDWVKNPVPLNNGPVEKFNVTAASGPNGTLDKEGVNQVVKGQSITFTALPDAGYEIDAATLENAAIEFVNNKYTVSGVTKDMTLDVTFKKSPEIFYNIEAVAGANGSLDPVGVQKVKKGDSITFTAVADAGFEIDATLDGAAVAFVNNTYTIGNVSKDSKLVVNFKEKGPEDVTAEYVISQDWGSGFGGQVTVINNTTSAINGWQVVWTYAGDVKVTSLWNASFSQSGKTVTVDNLSWNGSIPAGGKVTFGFNGTYTGSNEVPSDIKVIVK